VTVAAKLSHALGVLKSELDHKDKVMSVPWSCDLRTSGQIPWAEVTC